MELGDSDALEAATRVARELGELGEVTPLPADAIHPVLRAGWIVIRLEVTERDDEVTMRVDNCRRMCASGVPFVMPVTAEPIRVPGYEWLLATAWEYVEPVQPLDWVALGGALAAFHSFDQLTVDADAPLSERLAHAVDTHPTLDAALAERFRSMIQPFEATLAEAGWDELALMPSHGDPWTKNVIPRGAGSVVLCDPDFIGLRPSAFDLGIVHRETDGDDRWDQFVEGYGRELPSLEQLVAGYQAPMVNWIVYVLEHRRDWVEYTEELAKGSWLTA